VACSGTSETTSTTAPDGTTSGVPTPATRSSTTSSPAKTSTTQLVDVDYRPCGSLAAEYNATWRQQVAAQDELVYTLAIGDLDRARELVDAGHDVNVALEDMWLTPLVAAVDSGCGSAVDWLLEAGAEPGLRVGDVEPILLAARWGQASVIELLLEAGADPNTAGYDSQATSLHLAVDARCLECLDILLAAGADIEAVNYARTPLDNAATNGWLDGVNHLVAAGAGSLQNALYEAIREDQVEAVKLLVDHGADPDAPSAIHGDTANALEWAIRVGATQSEQYLNSIIEP
jgi:ankyrin repeat protein